MDDLTRRQDAAKKFLALTNTKYDFENEQESENEWEDD